MQNNLAAGMPANSEKLLTRFVPVFRIILPIVTPTLLNTAGELEADARSRRWNGIEALVFCCAILIALWPIAYGLGVLGGVPFARELAYAIIATGFVWAFGISPFLHRDTTESWGCGNPRQLWRSWRGGSATHRWRLLVIICLVSTVITLLIVRRWWEFARFFKLPMSVRMWMETSEGAAAATTCATIFAFAFTVTTIRFDNFGPAFRTALKISAALIAPALLAAYLHRGPEIFATFNLELWIWNVLGYVFWGFLQQLFFTAWLGQRLRKAIPPGSVESLSPARKRRVVLIAGSLFALTMAPAFWIALRLIRGSEAMPLSLLAWFAAFAFPTGAIWGWFYCRDSRRTLVATLAGGFFGFIHMDSYGLVLVCAALGTTLAWITMEDRRRNLVALGFIHGFLGTTFSWLFRTDGAGALRISYHVGPWNVRPPEWHVLVIPLVVCGIFLALLRRSLVTSDEHRG